MTSPQAQMRWKIRRGLQPAAYPTPAGRFMAYVAPQENGCWQWVGALSDTGYGTFLARRADGGRLSTSAHRFSYQSFKGPIPPGLHIDHLCRNRRCVNPDHLEAVTPAENNRRANPSPGECRKGHRMVVMWNGRNRCPTCSHDRYERRKAA